MPSERQKKVDHEPPASTTALHRVRPFSVTTSLTFPPEVSKPRTAQACTTLAPNFRAPCRIDMVTMWGSAHPSDGVWSAPAIGCAALGASLDASAAFSILVSRPNSATAFNQG